MLIKFRSIELILLLNKFTNYIAELDYNHIYYK